MPHEPHAAIFDARIIQSTPESGAHAGWDGAKRWRGRKVRIAVDTLGQLLALLVTPAARRSNAPRWRNWPPNSRR